MLTQIGAIVQSDPRLTLVCLEIVFYLNFIILLDFKSSEYFKYIYTSEFVVYARFPDVGIRGLSAVGCMGPNDLARAVWALPNITMCPRTCMYTAALS